MPTWPHEAPSAHRSTHCAATPCSYPRTAATRRWSNPAIVNGITPDLRSPLPDREPRVGPIDGMVRIAVWDTVAER